MIPAPPIPPDPDEEDPLALPMLTPEDMVLLEKNQLMNALRKIKNGQSINAREQALIDAAKNRSLAAANSENPTPGTPPPAENSSFALHGEGERSRSAIAADYHLNGEPLSVRTIDRCNAIGRLPAVNCPPPWQDPHALAEWYRLHYRSDITKPARTNPKEKLPAWILAAVARSPASPASIQSTTDLHLPSQPSTLNSQPAPGDILSDPLASAEAMLREVHARWLRTKHDPAQAPAAERAYLDCLERVQLARERARKAGDTEAQIRTLVEETIDRVHRQLPEHLAGELAAVRRDLLLEATNADTFPAWCLRFYRAVGERLARVHFQPAKS